MIESMKTKTINQSPSGQRRVRLLIALCFCLLFVSPVIGQAKSNVRSLPQQKAARRVYTPTEKQQVAARAAIQGVLDAQTAAWNAGKLEEFMEGYWKSPELTFVSGGRKLLSWEATLERYRKTYQAEGKEMGQVTFTDVDINLLSADAAFVRGQWGLTMKDGKQLGGRYTLLFRKFVDGWKIIHDHTSSN